ncbi:hypothetical protein KCP69_06710 [Salmonella enterica subsp. enterica]|nr:hypothetical protein KCP69_06710 [Salmonella enterica subsp. enterica]
MKIGRADPPGISPASIRYFCRDRFALASPVALAQSAGKSSSAPIGCPTCARQRARLLKCPYVDQDGDGLLARRQRYPYSKGKVLRRQVRK